MVRWNIEGDPKDVSLHVRPFLSGRNFHGIHHAHESLNTATMETGFGFFWKAYADLPEVYIQTNAKVDAKSDACRPAFTGPRASGLQAALPGRRAAAAVAA